LQSKLLQLLQTASSAGSVPRKDKEGRSTRSLRDNRNLESEIEGGTFRQDPLYYRINVVNLRMPALPRNAEATSRI